MKNIDNTSFIEILVTPNLRTSTLKTLQHIQYKAESYDTLLLNFPEELENKVAELASEQITQDEFLEHLEKHEIIPQPITSWTYTAQPLLEAIPRLHRDHPNLKIHCYHSTEAMTNSMNISTAYAQLTLRTIITNKIEYDSWRETINQSLQTNSETLANNCKSIQNKSGTTTACITVSTSHHLKQKLTQTGATIKITYIEKPYHFTPLAIIERKTTQKPLTNKQLDELIHHHIHYIKNYIYRHQNRDRAHLEWTLDKKPWPKLHMDRREIALLDNIIP